MPPKNKKLKSGYEKRKKKKRLDELTHYEIRALSNFIIKEQKYSV